MQIARRLCNTPAFVNPGGRETRSGTENDMSLLHLQSTHAVSTKLHPAVHMAVAALFIWFLAAAWLLFGGSGYIGLALAMISVLVFMMLGIPVALWRAGDRRRRLDAGSTASDEPQPPAGTGQPESWSSWLRGDFSTSTDQEKGTEAAVEILLPITAVAFGMTALGIVFVLTRAGVV
jgi:hypothetical protein